MSGTNLVLCYLTDDWLSRVSDGPRNKGQTFFYKYGITASSFGWQLTEFRKDTVPVMRVHASRFADLTPSFKKEAGLKAFDCIRRIQQALEAIAKLSPDIKPLPTDVDLDIAIDYAEQVDSFYKTNFTLYDDVKTRYFGSSAVEEEDEDEK